MFGPRDRVTRLAGKQISHEWHLTATRLAAKRRARAQTDLPDGQISLIGFGALAKLARSEAVRKIRAPINQVREPIQADFGIRLALCEN
jgi:hypothetical protein